MENFQTQDNMMGTPMTPAPKQGNGSSLAIIIILLIIALGGAYFWYYRNAGLNSANSPSPAKESVADDSATLDNELNAAGNVDLSADMNNLDKEFGN